MFDENMFGNGLRKLIGQRQMEPDRTQPGYWSKRRAQLRNQALQIERLSLESSGQMTLPIFGDGSAKKLAESEVSTLPLKGMTVTEKKA